MKATTFNTLDIARKLKDSGLPEDQAEVIAEGMREAAVADRDDLATKGDIRELRVELKAEIGWVKKLLYIVLTVVTAAAINSFFFT